MRHNYNNEPCKCHAEICTSPQSKYLCFRQTRQARTALINHTVCRPNSKDDDDDDNDDEEEEEQEEQEQEQEEEKEELIN